MKQISLRGAQKKGLLLWGGVPLPENYLELWEKKRAFLEFWGKKRRKCLIAKKGFLFLNKDLRGDYVMVGYLVVEKKLRG